MSRYVFCSSWIKVDDPLITKYLPAASDTFMSSFKYIQTLYHISKQPQLRPTIHTVMLDWMHLFKSNPYSSEEHYVGRGPFNEGVQENINRPLLQLFSHHTQKNRSPLTGVKNVFKRRLFNTNPKFYPKFTECKPKATVSSSMFQIFQHYQISPPEPPQPILPPIFELSGNEDSDQTSFEDTTHHSDKIYSRSLTLFDLC